MMYTSSCIAVVVGDHIKEVLHSCQSILVTCLLILSCKAIHLQQPECALMRGAQWPLDVQDISAMPVQLPAALQ